MDKWNPPDQGSDWATTQETVPLSNLVSFTHHSPDTWFLQNIVPLGTIPFGICFINLALYSGGGLWCHSGGVTNY